MWVFLHPPTFLTIHISQHHHEHHHRSLVSSLASHRITGVVASRLYSWGDQFSRHWMYTSNTRWWRVGWGYGFSSMSSCGSGQVWPNEWLVDVSPNKWTCVCLSTEPNRITCSSTLETQQHDENPFQASYSLLNCRFLLSPFKRWLEVAPCYSFSIAYMITMSGVEKFICHGAMFS